MTISVLTIFPELFDGIRKAPIIRRLQEAGTLTLQLVDIKDFAGGSFRHIDDSPYGGGAGMILRFPPLLAALEHAKGMTPEIPAHTVILTPAGHPFRQADAHRLGQEEHLILICGHYEGMDARINEYAQEQISIGDYVLSGGEVPAMVLIDSITRLAEGALRKESTQDESFENGLLEYPQYTRPAVYDGKAVPEVLLSGNHEAIRRWREEQSRELTQKNRPDLWKS